mmetsp:Transcript_25127/g.32641  ORF Transcript_25127/g.32641 Transcript_25127/m.32641 type:complete len:405 (+) Transcript_25127:48-1262(+)
MEMEDFISLKDDENEKNDADDSPIPKSVPWFRKESYSNTPLVTLHNEMLDFCDLVVPNTEEQEIRTRTIEDVKMVLLELWPDADIHVFGSEFTQLALPTSDVDLTALNVPEEPRKRHLHRAGDHLKSKGIIDYLEVIDSARIPIVKIRHKESQVHVDISFNQPGGLKTGAVVRKFMQKFPPVRPLLLVLKQFMLQRELNETYTGGVGSFLLQLMVINFVQHHLRNAHRTKKDFQYNLGALLVDFLELYGLTFNYVNTGISVRHNGSYFNKRQGGCFNAGRPGLICVENPEDPDLDVGKNSFRIMMIRRVFGHAYNRLVARLCKQPRPEGTVLGSIIYPNETLIERSLPDELFYKGNSYLREEELLRSASKSVERSRSQNGIGKKRRRKDNKGKRKKNKNFYQNS